MSDSIAFSGPLPNLASDEMFSHMSSLRRWLSREELNSLMARGMNEFPSLFVSVLTVGTYRSHPNTPVEGVLPLIGSYILDQINGSLVSGYVPRSYKVAVIKPLLKKPSLDPDVLANYRPISNLPFISKVLEKVVVTQLLEHLQRNSLFEMCQSGFRANHSTETALLKVTNDLLIASDHGLVSMLVLLDLSAAFDTVDHSILLQRLEHVIGIKGTALDWFRSYLSNRYQFAHVHGVPSSYRRVSHGVPQGSVLGPILFTLYMLPLGNIIRQHGIHFHCYADDTQLYLSMKPEETEKLVKLQTCLKDIKYWMSSNFLLLNPGKTEVMVFGPEPLRVSKQLFQLIQNAAARVLTGIDKRDHITPVMALLHWLPIKFRIIFKTLLLSYKVLRGLAPSYLEELFLGVEWGAKHLATRPPCYGTSSLSRPRLPGSGNMIT
ncbi:putative RNA-directed DNA polymerase from transposon X-element [Takifugu flavidus]|uniref:Putative RNA-directed DNA polymerase from transposon X-element n=1 Tax=Takifugu flavidus TaxID=433684 RepID=A0A5C6NWW0_9TELE|nr:putative RNA-directed DNA polymerase from transposon X-element [Takifugu flavidus]